MSNCVGSPSTPRPSSRIALGRSRPAPSPSSSGAASRRTRSASKRSLPAETGRVDGEHARRGGPARGPSSRVDAGGHQLAGPLDEQERRVALVEVPGRGRDAQRAERPDAADAQDQLLVEAHLAAADVQDVGDRPVGLVVVGHVGVQQQQRHAADLGQPDGDVHGRGRAARRARGAGRRSSSADAQERQAGEVVVGVGVLLVAVGVDRLAEVAVAVEQARRRRTAGPCPRPTCSGRRRARPGRRSRCPATRGGRTRRRSRRSGRRARRRAGGGTSGPRRWRCRRRSRARIVWYSAMKSGSSRSARPVDAGPRGAGSGCGSAPRPRGRARLNRARASGCQVQ